MNGRLWRLLALAIPPAVTGPLGGAPPHGPPAQSEVTPPRYDQLENGLKLVVVEDPTAPGVFVQISYCLPPDVLADYGSAGLAAVEGRTIAAEASEIEQRAVRGAQLTPDALSFYASAASDALPTLLDAAAARLGWCEGVPAQEPALASAHGHALDDKRVWDGPDQAALSRLFEGHPYARFGAVRTASASATTAHEERLRDLFSPANARFLVVGDVQAAVVLDMIRRRCSELAWRQPQQWSFADLPPPQAMIEAPPHATGPSEYEALWMLPAFGSASDAALGVLFERLANRVDGELTERLKGLGPCHTSMDGIALREARIVRLRTRVDATPPDVAPSPTFLQWHAVVTASLEHVAGTVPDEVRHLRARALAAARLRRAALRFETRAAALAQRELARGDLPLARFDEARVGRVSVGAVQEAARLLRAARCLVRARPPEHDESPCTAAHDRVPLSWDCADGAAAAASGVATREIGNRDRSPLVTTLSLPGAVRLHVVPRPGAPATLVRALSSGASAPARAPSFPLEDYCTYHGIEVLSPGPAGAAIGAWQVLGPPGELAAMVELARGRAPIHPVAARDLIVVGDTDAESLRQVWSDLLGDAAGAAPPPASVEALASAPIAPLRSELVLRVRQGGTTAAAATILDGAVVGVAQDALALEALLHRLLRQAACPDPLRAAPEAAALHARLGAPRVCLHLPIDERAALARLAAALESVCAEEDDDAWRESLATARALAQRRLDEPFAAADAVQARLPLADGLSRLAPGEEAADLTELRRMLRKCIRDHALVIECPRPDADGQTIRRLKQLGAVVRRPTPSQHAP